jgi:hypothetical protein
LIFWLDTGAFPGPEGPNQSPDLTQKIGQTPPSADQIRGVLADRSNANNNAAESPSEGVTHINAGPMRAQIKRLSSQCAPGCR